jgi:hypothetical protein
MGLQLGLEQSNFIAKYSTLLLTLLQASTALAIEAIEAVGAIFQKTES